MFQFHVLPLPRFYFSDMFVKAISLKAKDTGKRYNYFRLCESYRIGGAPRHRNILNLGTLIELADKGEHKLLADRIEQLIYGKSTLFPLTTSSTINRLAEYFAGMIIRRRLVDIPQADAKTTGEETKPDYHPVDINSIDHPTVREVGAEWLCKQTLDRLKLADRLRELEWKEHWIKLAMIYIIGRTIFPASDLKTADWLQRNSALAELYGMEAAKITHHHLYHVSRKLYREKTNIESFLSLRTNELFDLEDKIVLYDLTNTYFEGQKKASQKAKFGRSKEKRSDAKLMALALVTNADGFVKYSKVYAGNIKDHSTLEQTLQDIGDACGNNKRRKVVVMDAGIATEDNLKMLREKQYDYVCVSLSRMKEYTSVDCQKSKVKLADKEGNKLMVQWVKAHGIKDKILYVQSERKQLKEEGMERLHCKRYEEGLEAIRQGIEKKGGVKKADKVYERMGRLKEKYPSVHRYYTIKVSTHQGIAGKIEWKKTADGGSRQGVYFVRTTLPTNEEKTLWDLYNTIREIEATFRTLKSDLKMRPVFHQFDINSEAHIYGSILAYTIVQSIRHPLRGHGKHSDWANIVRTMNTQKVITTTMQTRTGKTLCLKKCSEPESDVREIYATLSYQDRPFWQKKSVLPKTGNSKSQITDTG